MVQKNNPSDRILVLGANGQVGRAFLELLDPSITIAATRKDADLSNPKACLDWIDRCNPSVILNASAYTQVDLAEKEVELAQTVNAEAPGMIAKWCASHNVPFVHFSTDYVFPGTGTTPWRELDPISPLNSYGRTKAEGEKKILEAGGRFLIFRTSWVYDAHGKNFLKTMIKLGMERDSLRIVNDQTGAPTYAPDLAKGAWQGLKRALELPQFPSGIYHLSNQGETTWYQFAKAIFELGAAQGIPFKIKQVDPILSSEYPTPAQRPMNSRLNMEKVYQTLGVRLPHWQESLKVCLRELK